MASEKIGDEDNLWAAAFCVALAKHGHVGDAVGFADDVGKATEKHKAVRSSIATALWSIVPIVAGERR